MLTTFIRNGDWNSFENFPRNSKSTLTQCHKSDLVEAFSMSGHHSIAVIAVEPAIIYFFVKKVCKRGKRVNALVNTIQVDLLALFVCQTTENSNNAIPAVPISLFVLISGLDYSKFYYGLKDQYICLPPGQACRGIWYHCSSIAGFVQVMENLESHGIL